MVKDEIIIEVNNNDQVLGLKPRGDFADGRLIHRSSYLLLFNSKGEFLLQKRSLDKKWYPGLWTYPVAGTVANESYRECIEREMKEALGIKLPHKELFKYHHFDNIDKAFKKVFLTKAEQDNLILNKNYAEEYDWFSVERTKRELKNNPRKFAPPFITGMKLFFEKYFKPEMLLYKF